MSKCDKLRAITGQHIMFLGTNTKSWTTGQFTDCAAWCQKMGVDTVLLKVADGYEKWYGGATIYSQIRSIFLQHGVGCGPYTWMYGDKYGYLDKEIDILLEYMPIGGFIVADMEQEWNGQNAWCKRLAARMQNVQGTFAVSTWADPDIQNWVMNIKILAPIVDIWMPQVYSDNLDGMVDQYANLVDCLQPTVMLESWAGANHPVNIAMRAYRNGHTAISVWYYEQAKANESLTSAIFNAFPKTPITTPVPIVKPPGTIMNANINKALQDEWYLTAAYFKATQQPQPVFDTNMAIVQKWVDCALANHRLGPPLSVETPTVDWNGNAIIVMVFLGGGRIEYTTGSGCRVFTTNGEIVL